MSKISYLWSNIGIYFARRGSVHATWPIHIQDNKIQNVQMLYIRLTGVEPVCDPVSDCAGLHPCVGDGVDVVPVVHVDDVVDVVVVHHDQAAAAGTPLCQLQVGWLNV